MDWGQPLVPCKLLGLGIGLGFVRCTSDVLKTIIWRGDQPRAVKFVVLSSTINPFPSAATQSAALKKASEWKRWKMGAKNSIHFVRFQFSEFHFHFFKTKYKPEWSAAQ